MFNKQNHFVHKSLKNENGMALMLVMGVIAILTFLLAEFTIDTKLNKLKIYNQQDKIQARLNAESGLNIALAKLRLYQEGRNKIEKDENLKNNFPSSDLESIIIEPFAFPPPVANKKLNIIQKGAFDEFLKKTIMKGELIVTFNKVSGFLNPNALRIIKSTDVDKGLGGLTETPNNENGNDKKNNEPSHLIIEKKMVEALGRLMKDKSDQDEDFHRRYANIDPNYLIRELKYYVNNRGAFSDQEIEAKFTQKNIIPKFAPMTSIDELYHLPSWDDDLVDLFKNRLSVHEVGAIAINEITSEDLKILFPSINNIQIEEFFKIRDGDPDKKIKPRKFKNADDFKNVITNELNIVNGGEYQERIDSLKSAGLVIDTAGKLYKVISKGSYNNAIYNLIAYIDLPIKPTPKKPAKKPNDPSNINETNLDNNENQAQASNDPNNKSNGQEKKEPIELLSPRVIEVRVE